MKNKASKKTSKKPVVSKSKRVHIPLKDFSKKTLTEMKKVKKFLKSLNDINEYLGKNNTHSTNIMLLSSDLTTKMSTSIN